jgi:Skp family chaperone for outer membrane proteins
MQVNTRDSGFGILNDPFPTSKYNKIDRIAHAFLKNLSDHFLKTLYSVLNVGRVTLVIGLAVSVLYYRSITSSFLCGIGVIVCFIGRDAIRREAVLRSVSRACLNLDKWFEAFKNQCEALKKKIENLKKIDSNLQNMAIEKEEEERVLAREKEEEERVLAREKEEEERVQRSAREKKEEERVQRSAREKKEEERIQRNEKELQQYIQDIYLHAEIIEQFPPSYTEDLKKSVNILLKHKERFGEWMDKSKMKSLDNLLQFSDYIEKFYSRINTIKERVNNFKAKFDPFRIPNVISNFSVYFEENDANLILLTENWRDNIRFYRSNVCGGE